VILLDTNAVVYYLHGVEPYASKAGQVIAEAEDLAVTLRIIDEVVFTLIRLEGWRRHGVRRLSELKEYIRKHGIKEFYDVLNDVGEFVDKLGIRVLEDRGTFVELIDIIRKYHLLPGDTLIALTCRYYGISTILTFDEDFKRIPWLQVIP